MSILSPVWRAKLCGDIGGEARWQLALDGGETGLFRKLVALGSGAAVTVEGGVEGLMGLVLIPILAPGPLRLIPLVPHGVPLAQRKVHPLGRVPQPGHLGFQLALSVTHGSYPAVCSPPAK